MPASRMGPPGRQHDGTQLGLSNSFMTPGLRYNDPFIISSGTAIRASANGTSPASGNAVVAGGNAVT